ncbi:MAG: hypothetical protein AAGF11_22785 [Myxococcota bacterium]
MRGSAPACGAKTTVLAVLLLAGCSNDAPPPPAEDGSSSGGPSFATDDGADVIPTACVPGQARPCYEGPFGTVDVGRCRSGQQICSADGSVWSACEGEIRPADEESCQTPEDDDCDGSVQCSPTLEWILPISGLVQQMTATPDGGAVVCGFGNGLGPGTFGAFVLAVDAQGQVKWERTIDEEGFQEVFGLKADADGQITLAGRYEGAPDYGGGPLPSAVALDSFAVRYDAEGNYLWGQTLGTSAYTSTTTGPDGTAYVSGGVINLTIDGEQVSGNFFVAAISPSGELGWVTTGGGAFPTTEYWYEMDMVGDDEIALLVMLEPFGVPEFGGVPLELELPFAQPVLFRLGTDGAVRGYDTLSELPAYISGGRIHVHSRSDGEVTTASGVFVAGDSGTRPHILVTRSDGVAPPVQTQLIGENVVIRAVDRDPPGGIVLGIDFSGQLRLGDMGISAPLFSSGQAVTVVDDQGQARWVELLGTEDYADLRAVAASSDGAVFVAADIEGLASFAGHTVVEPFIAKLRP